MSTQPAQETTLTPEEEKEFTHLNCLAFADAVEGGRKANTAPPMWLCTSEERRDELRRAVLDQLDKKFTEYAPFDVDSANDFLRRMRMSALEQQLANWKQHEIEMKALRATNPRAFFFPIEDNEWRAEVRELRDKKGKQQ